MLLQTVGNGDKGPQPYLLLLGIDLDPIRVCRFQSSRTKQLFNRVHGNFKFDLGNETQNAHKIGMGLITRDHMPRANWENGFNDQLQSTGGGGV